ncbi:MAG TPA: 2-phospho-L-lactate guanylyltransferase [Solirubrobacteraceae bacterium]|jgi:2-phospho-L-lactate guanylyltransferase
MRTAAILPVKRFSHAKQRLGAGVGERLRGDLARAMVSDVLETLRQIRLIDQTIVITSEPSVARSAREQGASVLADSSQAGQSAAVSLGIAHALTQGFQRALCVPGDCPALDPDELEDLLSRQPQAPTVLVIPDRHGSGTNGLLLVPPDAIAPSFGPDSCARHLELARVAGVQCSTTRPQSLLLDVDTREDLDLLRERLSSAGTRAPRTRAALGLSTASWPLSPPAA